MSTRVRQPRRHPTTPAPSPGRAYAARTLLPRQEKLEKTGTPERYLTCCMGWDNPALTLAIEIITQPQILASGVENIVFLHGIGNQGLSNTVSWLEPKPAQQEAVWLHWPQPTKRVNSSGTQLLS